MYYLAILMQLLVTQDISSVTQQVTVSGDSVCLRAGPSEDKEVVFQVNKGQVLQAFHTDGDWMEILPPEECNVWIHKELVNESVVIASKARIRAGPGINFTYIGRVDKGTQLNIRDTKGEWLKIAPPKGCSLWISSLYAEPVKHDQSSDAEAELMTGLNAKPVVSNSVVSAAKDEALTDYAKPPMPLPLDASIHDDGQRPVSVIQPLVRKSDIPVPAGLPPDSLDPSKEQAANIQYSGFLRKAGIFSSKLTKYRIIKLDIDGRPSTLCYVLGNMDQLSTVIGRNMTIAGPQYWLKSKNYPIVIPETITLGQ